MAPANRRRDGQREHGVKTGTVRRRGTGGEVAVAATGGGTQTAVGSAGGKYAAVFRDEAEHGTSVFLPGRPGCPRWRAAGSLCEPLLRRRRARSARSSLTCPHARASLTVDLRRRCPAPSGAGPPRRDCHLPEPTRLPSALS